jgi:hypothetical protein
MNDIENVMEESSVADKNTDPNKSDPDDQDMNDKLNEIYKEAEEIDTDLFAEQRSHILLVAGDHYSKITTRLWNNIRTRTDITDQQKVRLTKNHTQKIQKTYVNYIMSGSPGIAFYPSNEKDEASIKSAELRESVWQHSKRRYRLKKRFREDANDFVTCGEVYTKIFWNPNIGDFVGYEQAVDENGLGLTNEDGSLQASERAVFSGDFEFKRVYGFNLLRAPSAKTIEESPYLIDRSMVDVKLLKDIYADQPDKLKFITTEMDKTYVVFDAQKGTYGRAKNQTMLREHFYRPCPEYPTGYFYIKTETGILEQGELPAGVFPIIGGHYEQVQTSPRGRSPLKHGRPYQMEINRTASKIAEHQITLGDDKVVLPNGAKLSQGGMLPGIRGLTASSGQGQATVIPGRDGSQYLTYMGETISEYYKVMNADEMDADQSGDLDAYALLFRSASQKKRFSGPIESFEQYLQDFASAYMKLAQYYLPDNLLIPMVGKSEFVNLDEFRNATDSGFEMRTEAISDDIESQMGQQLVMNQILQYAGGQLSKDDIGALIAGMPFMQDKTTLSDMTLDSETATNAILALNRGKPYQVHQEDNHPYMIKKLTNRIRKPDFELLPKMIQNGFYIAVANHDAAQAAQVAAAIRAKSAFIPTGGALVVCDLYVKDPKNLLSSKRVRLPYDALNWLITTLQTQGNTINQVDSMDAVNGPHVVDLAQRQVQPGPGSPGQIAGPGSPSQAQQPQAGGNLPEMPGASQ